MLSSECPSMNAETGTISMTSIAETKKPMDARAEMMLDDDTKLQNLIYKPDLISFLETKMHN